MYEIIVLKQHSLGSVFSYNPVGLHIVKVVQSEADVS